MFDIKSGDIIWSLLSFRSLEICKLEVNRIQSPYVITEDGSILYLVEVLGKAIE